ncbi:MAG: Glu-tRNA(Gln) amidotransferase subunit GatE [Candidatus Thermoplasmatota archaeon]|jgi:glutamyl-tRNA(Gln) amidotransferase subunit E|nr:Glu-tRNA(Gln) amidotransferase subunit GatE [Candidatus Thermoplasmatota archaeon]
MSVLDELSRPEGPDISGLGLKVGLEVHRQIEGTKLFCSCPTDLSDDPFDTVRRKLNITRSELGEEDDAVQMEVGRGRVNTYQVQASQCLVELDEEPPHPPSQGHIETALVVAKMLNAIVPSEVQFMRKLVADGSDTTGFQRTALVGLGGHIDVMGLRLGIVSVCIEEDAARKISETDEGPVYRLDRLGTPELEVTTEPTMNDPELAGAAARTIGDMLRSTGLFKRGIGTIRQDVNVSIEGGARTELKLVQELNMVPRTIVTEAIRQHLLIEVASVLRERGVTPLSIPLTVVDVTDLFFSTSSKVVQNGLKGGGRVLALPLKGFGGLMGERTVMARLQGSSTALVRKGVDDVRRLGPEFAYHVRVRTGLKGLFHSDELPSYGITVEELTAVQEHLGVDPALDGFVMVCAEHGRAMEALKAVHRRALASLLGVPSEVRRPLPDGRSEYMRPMPGPARMYPETDIPTIVITDDMKEAARKRVPEAPSARVHRLAVGFGLSEETVRSLNNLELLDELEGLSASADPKLVSLLLLQGYPRAREKGLDPSSLSEKALLGTISGVGEGLYSKEALPSVLCQLLTLRISGMDEESALRDARKACSGDTDLGVLVEAARKVAESGRDIIMAKGEGALGPLMGPLMKEMRGRFDGALISSTLKDGIRRVMEGRD